jgi:hypothetical protein
VFRLTLSVFPNDSREAKQKNNGIRWMIDANVVNIVSSHLPTVLPDESCDKSGASLMLL